MVRETPSNAELRGDPHDPEQRAAERADHETPGVRSQGTIHETWTMRSRGAIRNTPAVRSREVIRETPAVRTEGINGTQLVRALGRSPVERSAPVCQPRILQPRSVNSGLPAPSALNHVPGALNHVGFDCPDRPTPEDTERTGRRAQSP